MNGVPGVIALESHAFLFFSSSLSSFPMATVEHESACRIKMKALTDIPILQWIPYELPLSP